MFFDRAWPTLLHGIGVLVATMGVGRGRQSSPGGAPSILKSSAKKVVFLLSSGKNQISPLLTPLEKSPGGLPWKKSFRRPWL